MKKSFITGLALLLPAILTLMIFLFLLNLFTAPFVGVMEALLTHYGLLDAQHLLMNKQLILFMSRIVVLIALVLTTLIIGFLGRLLLFHSLLKIGNRILNKIPFFNKIYRATQEVISTIFQTSAPSFSQVVLVPFPNAGNKCIGLITNDSAASSPSEHGTISVFIPATPNPTMGFMLLFKKEQLIFLDMKVDEAIRFIVSCGVMAPSFNVQHPEDSDAAPPSFDT